MATDSRQYSKWMKLALVITKGDRYIAEEILHIVLLEVLKKHNLETVKDNYIFISLKNRYISYMQNTPKHQDSKMSLFTEAEDVSSYRDDDGDNKLAAIKRVLHDLSEEDKRIFTLHFTRGFSQRKISRELGITLYYVISRVKHIKKLITQYYEKSKKTNEKKDLIFNS